MNPRLGPAAKAAALLLLVAPQAAAAQQRDTTTRDTVTLPPVTVSATRHTQNLFTVPLAVSRLEKRDLFGTRGYGLDEALALIPGVVAQSRYGTSDIRLEIRGFGARGAGDRSNAGTSRGIRVLVDGFPETEPDGRTSFDGIDLAAAHSIEVVRSNSSAVWGNAAGGVVSISTVPDVDGSLLSTDLVAGTFGLKRAAITAGTTTGQGGGQISASFVQTEFGGWREHSNSRRSLLNVALVTPPLADGTRVGVFALGSIHQFHIPGPLTRAQADSAPDQANATYLARDERRFNRMARLGVSLEHDWASGAGLSAALFVNPKFLQRSERGTFRDFTRYHVGGNALLRLPTSFGSGVRGTLLAGVDQAYQDGAILFYSLAADGSRGDTLRDNKREGALNLGAFLQEELEVGSRWTVALGARWDDIRYYYDSFIQPSLDADKSFQGVSPKLGVTYRVAPRHSVYASVGGGVEAPAGNETDPASTFGQDTVTALNPLLDPIRSTTFELGTRQTSSRLHYDVAVYWTEVRNEMVPYRGGRFYFTAGRARRRGLEVAIGADVAPAVSLETALAYQNHHYTEYVVDSVHYGVGGGATADYSGNKVVGVPDLTYTLNATWRPAWAGPARVKFGLQGVSNYFADDANQVEVPGYTVASLTIGLDEPVSVGPVALSGFLAVNNLFDRRYISSAFLNPDVVGGAPVAFEPGLPRNVVVSLSISRRP